MKYFVVAIRRNTENKKDYVYIPRWSNGRFVLFDSKMAAQEYADQLERDASFPVYSTRAIAHIFA
jgi:hypothetical protein